MLPLLERAREDSLRYALTPKSSQLGDGQPLYEISSAVSGSRIPHRAPAEGEQYRFHFNMAQCIGCKCCVVACNEQNGNPAEVNWRRIGEIEGGWYPNTQRFYLSMGCNHCLEPSCLIGCPVDAYRKDPATGIVQHSAETCIGCQYCTWNCSYGVPQYNPERGVVGKCDMCHGRLLEGREPACVNACPQGAIRVEIVNIADWKREYAASANAPGLPSADDSISTTRLTLPHNLPPETRSADFLRLKKAEPHWPLVMMTVLTQLSVGAFAAIWFLELGGKSGRLRLAAVASLFVGSLALAAATAHLGRPIHAYRALKMWKRSWLSREVLLFTLFSQVAAFYAGWLWWRMPTSSLLGGFTTLIGVGGVMASACIYRVRARPLWNTPYTSAEFFLTAVLLGSLSAANLSVAQSGGLRLASAMAASAQLLNQALKLLWLIRSTSFELQASARLLSGKLSSYLLLRGALLVIGGIVLPPFASRSATIAAALVISLAGEILGRYLFFVSVVPKNMAASYQAAGKEAA